MKHLIVLTIILTTMQCVANGKTGQTTSPVNLRKETMVRDRKIKSLHKELTDTHTRMLALIEIAESNKVKLLKGFSIDKSVDINSIERPKGTPPDQWLAEQEKIIEGLEKSLRSIKRQMFTLMYCVSSKGIKIPEGARIVIPEPPPYINPEWQEDYGIGAVADVGKIKISQQLKENCALVEVEYKAAIWAVWLGGFMPINRNTPKDTAFYSEGGHTPGEWTIMQFRGNFGLEKYTDGQQIMLDRRCIIVDRFTYNTVLGGTNTVFVAVPFIVK